MLFYQSYFPSAHLNCLVARYIIISDDSNHADWQQLEVMPNGLPGLGFSFGENFRYYTLPEGRQEISSGNVIGIHNRSYTASWKHPISFFVIVFKPFGLFPLLRTDMGELRNNLTGLRWLGLNESEQICESLSKVLCHREKIGLMERWLESRLSGAAPGVSISGEIAKTIIERKGVVAIGNLSREFNINRKYLERHFNLEMGLSPKEFAGIIRFNYMNTLLRQPGVSWKELAYLGNFHDQSHLIKHFQKMTGLTPTAFKQMADKRPEARFIKKHNVYELIRSEASISGNCFST